MVFKHSTVFKNPKKILTFIVTSSVILETFGESFLPLEDSFRFLLFTVQNDLKESEKKFQGAKINHQRFSK